MGLNQFYVELGALKEELDLGDDHTDGLIWNLYLFPPETHAGRFHAYNHLFNLWLKQGRFLELEEVCLKVSFQIRHSRVFSEAMIAAGKIQLFHDFWNKKLQLINKNFLEFFTNYRFYPKHKSWLKPMECEYSCFIPDEWYGDPTSNGCTPETFPHYYDFINDPTGLTTVDVCLSDYAKHKDARLHCIYTASSAYNVYLEFLAQLDGVDDIIAATREAKLKTMRLEQDPIIIPATTDKRKIDETIFWELIHEAKADEEVTSTSELVEKIHAKLLTFSATSIKAFGNLFAQKTHAAHHWDLWALAYHVRSGCGDDAFTDFQAWLVLQGQQHYTLALADPEAYAAVMNLDEDPQCEEAHSLASTAYEEKTTKELTLKKTPKVKWQGLEWDENDIPKTHPKLIEIINARLTKT